VLEITIIESYRFQFQLRSYPTEASESDSVYSQDLLNLQLKTALVVC